MKNKMIWNRFAALALCFVLLSAAVPLPQALAAPDDDQSVSDTTDTTDSADTANSDGTDNSDSDTANSDGTDSSDSDTDGTSTTAQNNDANVIAAAANAPSITAKSALLISPDSGMVLYEKNADARCYPASTTKIMTALLTLENVSDLSETVTAEASDFEHVTADSSNADIKEGEVVTVEDLLYALMLPSANEAAYMLARHVGGSWENFVDMMNARAAELGCTGTHFSNPCGLHEEDHYSTARDLYKIAYAAMQDETFANIADTVQYRMSKTNMHEERIIYTTNMLIFSSYASYSYPYCKGIKTGHTSQAGNCFVGYAEYGDAKLYSVVLGSADQSPQYPEIAASFTDTSSLCKWGFENFTSKTLVKQGDTIKQIGVALSTDTDKLVLTAKNDLVSLVPKDLDIEELTKNPVITAPESVDAPIKAGDIIGSVTYSYNGVDYGTVELVALSDVEMSRVLYYADKLSNFFQSTVFKVILIVLAVFVVLYILFNLTFGGIRRRRQRKNLRSRYENSNYQRRRRR
ncbi:D-alanyl-D-alanine carboxypeptidase family protein [Agathobaculum sp. Marseille-P7918]|uniref:D-alanyl-D-alanine carboxypeptidase family protein n=1 Tax=Agathobaculum sp. Marseille-P7918 TaxID=2479843 RepID=UPI0013DE6E51|nr:D-alanyl-D-alanine carboxypeptidase family protein [Agathobaculum sp. Marseille-P7918]